MNIYINEEKVETSLGNEKNLGDVFEEVSGWLQSKGFIITGFKLNGKDITRQELNALRIEENLRLDFYSDKKHDIILDSLNELDAYVDRIGNTILNRDSLTEKESIDLSDGVVWMKDILDTIGSLLKLDYKSIFPSNPEKPISLILIKLITLGKTMETSKEIEEFLDNLRDIKIFLLDLNNRLSSYMMDPATVKEVIELYSEKMDILKDEFIRVNESYQSGKDAVATELLSDCVNRLSSLVTSLMAVRSQPEEFGVESSWFEKKEYKDMADSLNEMMKEAIRCMETGDIVQAGDIFEYELPELLDNLVPFLKILKSKIG